MVKASQSHVKVREGDDGPLLRSKCRAGRPGRVGGVVARLSAPAPMDTTLGPSSARFYFLLRSLLVLFAGMVSKILWRALWISTRFPLYYVHVPFICRTLI